MLRGYYNRIYLKVIVVRSLHQYIPLCITVYSKYRISLYFIGENDHVFVEMVGKL